jgi:hypothetical protein
MLHLEVKRHLRQTLGVDGWKIVIVNRDREGPGGIADIEYDNTLVRLRYRAWLNRCERS